MALYSKRRTVKKSRKLATSKRRSVRRSKKRYSKRRALDGFGLGEELGSGMQGTVYQDSDDPERVIKCFSKSGEVNEKLMNLVGTTNIGPKYFGVYKTHNKYCYVQEKLYPIDMKKLESGGYDKELAELITNLATNGVFHNDLKFDNMLLTKDGHLRLIDFDLSKEISNYGYKTFDGFVRNNNSIHLEDGTYRPLKFTEKQMKAIEAMRPDIEKTLYEIEGEKKLKKSREEVRERMRLEQLERMKSRLKRK